MQEKTEPKKVQNMPFEIGFMKAQKHLFVIIKSIFNLVVELFHGKKTLCE